MEERERSLKISDEFVLDLGQIYAYGLETFGLNQATKYESSVWSLVFRLRHEYEIYPECKWILTKGRIYRNIILDSHLIIYRIKSERIDILRIFHSKSSITRIRSARNIKI